MLELLAQDALAMLHPGGNPGANLKSISHRCYLFEVAFVWELTKETIYLPLGCLQGGSAVWVRVHSPHSPSRQEQLVDLNISDLPCGRIEFDPASHKMAQTPDLVCGDSQGEWPGIVLSGQPSPRGRASANSRQKRSGSGPSGAVSQVHQPRSVNRKDGCPFQCISQWKHTRAHQIGVGLGGSWHGRWRLPSHPARF